MTTETNGRDTKGAGDPFSGEAARGWIEGVLKGGTLPTGTILVPSADMVETAALIARAGYRVKMVDASADGLRQARDRMKSAGFEFADVIRETLLNLKPWHLGPVHHAVDHTLFASLEPEQRFGYANRMARLVPTGGYLVGLFRIGQDNGTAPRAVPMKDFRQMLFRYFTPEVFELATVPEPGADEAWRAVLRRK